MEGIKLYLDRVVAGELPLNNSILYHLQDIFNLLPNLKYEEFTRSFAIKNSDQMLVIYLAAIVRAVIALHNLIGNKITNREAEKQEGEKDKPKKDDSKKEESRKDEKKESEKASGKGKEKSKETHSS